MCVRGAGSGLGVGGEGGGVYVRNTNPLTDFFRCSSTAYATIQLLFGLG